ncbi:oxidoreductase [Cupriavidus basilensis]
MAPLTRNRAGAGLVPSATGRHLRRPALPRPALQIITEATQVSAQAPRSYQDTPGLYTPEQIAGWRRVTEAVHARGDASSRNSGTSAVFRTSMSSLTALHRSRLRPSARRRRRFVNNGFVDVSLPRALEVNELPGIVGDFRQAAANAMAAGFDGGVEIHGANGYLLEQFIKDGANQRTDAYGGTIENRARLLLEVVAAVVAEIGADRTGVRISPVSPANGISSSDPQPQYDYIAEAAQRAGHRLPACGRGRDRRPARCRTV